MNFLSHFIARKGRPSDPPMEDSHDSFAMSNLFPEDTGLPFVVWISTGLGLRHGPRVKVALAKGDMPDRAVSVSIAPVPEVVADGHLRPSDLTLVTRWIGLNADVLLAHWRNEISARQALAQLRRLDGSTD
jgi:hypothetical protein